MDLSIITVTWNSAEHIGNQLASVQTAADGLQYEQLVVDNGSSDNTLQIVKQFPAVRLIEMGRNTGFGAANNAAANQSQGDFLLFLNPDMRATPGSFKMLVEWMRARRNVGIASCKLISPDGSFNAGTRPRRFPTWRDQLALVLKIPHFFPTVLNQYLNVDFNPDKEQPVDTVQGACFLMRRELYQKLGSAFDPRYLFWFEDVDACREAARLGYYVVYTPIVSCVDYAGQSFKKRATLWKQKQFTKSMVTYFKKWEPRRRWWLLWLARPIGITLAWLHDLL